MQAAIRWRPLSRSLLAMARAPPRLFPPAKPTTLERQQLQATARTVLGNPEATADTLLAAGDEGVSATTVRVAEAPGATPIEYVVVEAFVGDTAVGAGFRAEEYTLLAECDDGQWRPTQPAGQLLATALNDGDSTAVAAAVSPSPS